MKTHARQALAQAPVEDRAMLEACDYLISLQSGRLVEMAAADEMRARASSGWQRFVATRELESEDALDSWINAQFRRDGDGANRRAVCMVANEMLTLACRSDDPAATDTVCFEIKLFAGRCQLRMQQPQPLSSGALRLSVVFEQAAAARCLWWLVRCARCGCAAAARRAAGELGSRNVGLERCAN